jgi:hypothetical protein
VIVRADLRTGAVTLDEVDDVGGFHVEVAGGPPDDGRLAEALAPHGHVDGDHAWIRPEAVVALAGREHDADWRRRFDGMVAYAREKGFLDASGAIRAHVEGS